MPDCLPSPRQEGNAMAVKPSETRTRRIPLWVFLVYWLLALVVAAFAFTVAFRPQYDPCASGSCNLVYPVSAHNHPFDLPLQLLFGISAVSGLASIARWVAGVIARM